jgi:hypothetical protein
MRKTAPAYRYAHNCGVESLAWLNEGQILAVGCQRRAVQLYDLRANAPPLSMNAHSEMVSGIVPDCNAATTFATFGRNTGEPVKVWDARMCQSPLSEIALPRGYRRSGGVVGAVAWSISRPGVLSIGFEDSIRNYDTRSPGSRALPVGVSYLHGGDGVDDGNDFLSVQCLAYQPQFFRDSSGEAEVEESASTMVAGAASFGAGNPFEFYPHRTLAVTSRGHIQLIPESQIAPLAISSRDGRIASGLGGTVWIGPTTRGPSAMEGVDQIWEEDVSSRMMRRARCFHANKISTDALDNVRILEEERERILAEEHSHLIVSGRESGAESLQSSPSSKKFVKTISNIDQLLHCWRWIGLVENLSIDQRGNTEFNEAVPPPDDITSWFAKGLVDSGVTKLLRMSNRDAHDDGNGNWMMDTMTTSDTLFCDVFDSPLRR